MLRAEGEPLGKVQVQYLAVTAGGDKELAEVDHSGGRRTGLFFQFAQRGFAGIFAALELPSRDLLKHTGKNIAVLLHGEYIVVFVEGDDRDAAGVIGDLAHAFSAVRQEHVVAVNM